MFKNFFLVSDGHIPDRTIKTFDKLTTSIVEHGLIDFSHKKLTFSLAIIARADSRNDLFRKQFEVEAISIDELYYPLLIYVCLLISITIIFIIEFCWPRTRSHESEIQLSVFQGLVTE